MKVWVVLSLILIAYAAENTIIDISECSASPQLVCGTFPVADNSETPDEVTFYNPCVAAMAGASVMHFGACENLVEAINLTPRRPDPEIYRPVITHDCDLTGSAEPVCTTQGWARNACIAKKMGMTVQPMEYCQMKNGAEDVSNMFRTCCKSMGGIYFYAVSMDECSQDYNGETVDYNLCSV